jgi:hypothetical protein
MRGAHRVVWLAALGVLVPACCSGGPRTLSIYTTPAPSASDAACEWGTITWNETNAVVPGTNVIVDYHTYDADDGLVHTALELFDESGASVPLSEHRDDEAKCSGGCLRPRVHYTLPLEGTFTLVHRERTGTGAPVSTPNNSTDAWTIFDGERALVATIAIGSP